MTNEFTYKLLWFSLLLVLACSKPVSIGDQSLLEVEDLITALNNKQEFYLIDVRKNKAFEKGHIPTALNIWRTDIVDDEAPFCGMMISREATEKLLGKLGIKPEMPIVIYDNKGNPDAARFWWMLKTYGHEKVMLLNGGLQAWIDAEMPLDTKIKMLTAYNYQFKKSPDLKLFADIETVESAIQNPNTTLLDTRSQAEYDGKTRKTWAAKAGKIPTSVFLDWGNNVNYDGDKKFRTKEELTRKYTELGLHPDKAVVAYCQSGVRSAHTTFVLTEILGYKNVRNYDGSWIEWSHLR